MCRSGKEYLKSIRKLDIQIANKKLELQELKAKAYGLMSIKTDSESTPSSNLNNKSPQEKYITSIIECKEVIMQQLDELICMKREAMLMIDKVSDADCVDILYKRYFQFKRWEEIAVDKNYSIQHIYRLHGEALIKFNEVYQIFVNMREDESK